MFPNSGKAVAVDWIPGLQYTIAVALETYAAGDPSAGLAEADAVQLATGLSVLRSIVSQPYGAGLFATYDQKGRFLGERFADSAQLQAWYEKGITPTAVVGDNALSPNPAGEGVPADWSRQLALACDQCNHMVAKARTGPNIGGPIVASPVLALPAMTVIVTGAAVAVIGATAAWRYLDGEARAQIAAVEKAAEAYQARLEVYQSTGAMPPASEMETAAAGVVKTLSDKRRANRWYWAGAAVAGGGVAIVGTAALRRAMA